MSNNNSNIEQILEKRRKAVQQASETIDYIDRLIEILRGLISTSQDILNYPSVKEESQTQKKLNELDFNSLILRLEKERKVWWNLKKRFGRETINIGVIGRQRMGKSTFLQSITGLSDDVIPAKRGSSCTSVQSIIYHEDNNKDSEVHYYSESEFIEQVMKPYYETLSIQPAFKDMFKMLPSDLKDIKDLSKKLIPPKNMQLTDQPKDDLVRLWYTEFYNIVRYVSDYEEDIKNTKGTQFIDLGKVSELVQYGNKGDGHLSYKFAGIKKVLINCQFPNHHISKLGLIDLPGLGDVRLGDTHRLIRALNEDIDFAIFMSRTKRDAYAFEDVDVQLYTIANSILGEKLPLKKWAFMVINKDPQTEDLCEGLKIDMKNKRMEYVVEPIIANVMDSSEAAHVLDTAIEYLLDNIENLDNQIIKNSQKDLALLSKELVDLLGKASKLSTISSVESKFDEKFDHFFTELRNKSINLRDKLKEEGTYDDQDFVGQITVIVDKVKKDVKFLTEQEFNRSGGKDLNYYNAYCQSIHNVRSHVLRKFHDFTDKQQDKINKKKEEVAALLSNLLGGLHEKSNTSGLEFLQYIREQLEVDTQSGNSGIREGFDFICRFKISYDSSMQELVYSSLVQFFPDTIQGPGRSGDLTEFDNKIKAILAVELPSKSTSSIIQSPLSELNKRSKDLIEVCIAALGLFYNTELVANVYTIAKSIARILASESSEEQKELDLLGEIKKLEKKTTDKKHLINSSTDLLQDLQAALPIALDICKEELIQSFGNSTYKISRSMLNEFLDHIAYTLESEREWKEFLRTRRDLVWTDFAKDGLLNKKITEWNHAVHQAKDEIEVYPILLSR